MRVLVASLAIGFAAVSGGSAAHAAVYEIDDHGGVHVRGAGGDVQTIGVPSGNAASDASIPKVPDAAITPVNAPDVPERWRPLLTSVAARYRLSPDLLAALVWQESRWQPVARSPKGAVGLAQLMPGTARALAVDPNDPAANLEGGARYLRQMLDLFDGDIDRALAAYNAGPGRVIRAAGLPHIAETEAYVSAIMNRLTPTGPSARP